MPLKDGAEVKSLSERAKGHEVIQEVQYKINGACSQMREREAPSSKVSQH